MLAIEVETKKVAQLQEIIRYGKDKTFIIENKWGSWLLIADVMDYKSNLVDHDKFHKLTMNSTNYTMCVTPVELWGC